MSSGEEPVSEASGIGATANGAQPPTNCRVDHRSVGGGGAVSHDPEIERNVRRTVGIAALKRIRRIVDADNQLEAGKQRLARRLGIGLALAAALVLAWMLIR
jgi:hypothetical protein